MSLNKEYKAVSFAMNSGQQRTVGCYESLVFVSRSRSRPYVKTRVQVWANSVVRHSPCVLISFWAPRSCALYLPLLVFLGFPGLPPSFLPTQKIQLTLLYPSGSTQRQGQSPKIQ